MKTRPPFDGDIHAVSAKTMPDLNSPKREPGWFLGEPMTPSTNPARDEAVIWPERLTLRDTKVIADEGQRIFTTATGYGYEKREYVRADLTSAPAPASGVVDAGRVTLFSALEAAYIRGSAWCAEMGMTHTFAELRKSAYDYADKEEKDVICREVSASLPPAATSGSEAGCEATGKPSLQVGSIPRAENTGRYLAETNDGRLLYLNHANEWQEMPNILKTSGSEAEPVAWRWRYEGEKSWSLRQTKPTDWPDVEMQPLYLAKPSSPAGGDMREAVAEYGMKALPEDVCLRMEREARNLANLWANGDEPVRHAALALQVRTHVTALSPSTSAAEPPWSPAMTDEKALTVDDLAQEIRRVDGNHSLGAGALAEALMPFITQALSPGSTGEADGWQPIETAPKDGSDILLYGHGVLRSGGVYAKGHHVGWSQVARDGNIYWATRDPAVDCEPTHWRPLPEPPSAMLAAAGGTE